MAKQVQVQIKRTKRETETSDPPPTTEKIQKLWFRNE